jgi:hypothetical protein
MPIHLSREGSAGPFVTITVENVASEVGNGPWPVFDAEEETLPQP